MPHLKKMQKGFTLLKMLLVILVFGVTIPWIVNFVKLVNCDFDAPYRCEVAHTVGLVPAFAPVTVWFDSDKGN